MNKQELLSNFNNEFSLALNLSSWQKVEDSLLTHLQSALRDTSSDEEFDVDIPKWFSSRSQKHSTLLDISSLSGISMNQLKSLQTVPLADLYQIVVVLHARSLEESDSEEEDSSSEQNISLDSMREKYAVLIQKIQKLSDLEVENSLSAAVLLSSFGLEDVYYALFQERDGQFFFREDLGRPELWLLEAFDANVLSTEHQIFQWYSSGRLDQALLEALAKYSIDEIQDACSLVRRFLLRQVTCPSGSFWMGNEDTDSVRHRVHLSKSISVCVFPVTNALCALVNESHGDQVSLHPATKRSWFEAVQFCNHLSELEDLEPYYGICEKDVAVVDGSKGYRLLTEAEWEYVAKSATELPFSGSMDAQEVAWFKILSIR